MGIGTALPSARDPLAMGEKAPKPPVGLVFPEPVRQVARSVLEDYIAERRALLQGEMNNPGTDHRRRDILAGQLLELQHLAEEPKPAKPAKPTRNSNIYR